jgi:predicted N-formylglutamate amidohydrolase
LSAGVAPRSERATASTGAADAGSDGRALTPLLEADDPAPATVWRDGRRHLALLVCDHASAAVPRRLRDLGLPPDELRRHIGWDIGAADLARALAARLGLTLVTAGYSRLVIDCNRAPDDPTSILSVSDGTTIEANRRASRADRAARRTEIFEPYHRMVAHELAELASAGAAPALIAIHSFTERMAGVARPWHCGVLWDRDPRLAVPLLERLRAEPGLVVGDNEPYSGRHPSDYTIDNHAERRGWPHVCIEVRQDQLLTAASVGVWAERLARALQPLLDDHSLYRALQR